MPLSISCLIRVVDTACDHEIGNETGEVVPLVVWQVLDTVLAVSLDAVLAGAQSLTAIADWAGDLPIWSWRRWRIIRRPPSLSTIRRVLLVVDADVLDAVLHAWLPRWNPCNRRNGCLPHRFAVLTDCRASRCMLGISADLVLKSQEVSKHRRYLRRIADLNLFRFL